MSTYIASFIDANSAARAVTDLLEKGVPEDDLSLLTHKSFTESEDEAQGGRLTDATSFVGRSDDPNITPEDAFRPGGTSRTTLAESEIGAGISTNSSDDDASSVDEMDDSQDAAGDMIYPRQGISQGTHEGDDVDLTMITNFPTPVPVIDDFRDDLPSESDMDLTLESIIIPNFGVVMGGGSLATAALGDGGEESSHQSVVNALIEEGVNKDLAESLFADFKKGSALLAVTITPGEVDAVLVEQIGASYSPTSADTFAGKRY